MGYRINAICILPSHRSSYKELKLKVVVLVVLMLAWLVWVSA
jgi:hypothetical protein